MFGALEMYAQANQAVLVTPFIIAGAMSPVTMAATIAQQNAEALFGIAYAQMFNPGTPCIYGSFLANIDMKSGAPCFGTPEDTLALYAGAQMARHYRIPYRSGGNFTASRIPGCPGRLRIGRHDVADDPGGHELRAARRGLVRGRVDRRL